MTKTELLARARDGAGLSGVVLDFATAELSEDEAAQRYTRARRAQARWETISRVVILSVFLLIFLGLLGYIGYLFLTGGQPVSKVDVMVGLAGSTGVALIGMIFSGAIMSVVRGLVGYEDSAQWLTPLAGTSFCEQGLQILQNGGPDVQAWRDLALQERNQLLLYDYEVMNALRQTYDEERRTVQEQARQDAACRALHGLPTAPTAQI